MFLLRVYNGALVHSVSLTAGQLWKTWHVLTSLLKMHGREGLDLFQIKGISLRGKF